MVFESDRSIKIEEKVKSQLHNCHFGVSRMKALSRSYIWWLNIARDIENTIKFIETVK